MSDRRITWTLSFICKTNFFGPLGQGKVIKTAITNIGLLGDGTEQTVETITVTPTTDPSKPIDQITKDDDYGYSIEITDHE